MAGEVILTMTGPGAGPCCVRKMPSSAARERTTSSKLVADLLALTGGDPAPCHGFVSWRLWTGLILFSVASRMIEMALSRADLGGETDAPLRSLLRLEYGPGMCLRRSTSCASPSRWSAAMILFAASCSPYVAIMCCIGIEEMPPRTSRRLVQVVQAHST